MRLSREGPGTGLRLVKPAQYRDRRTPRRGRFVPTLMLLPLLVAGAVALPQVIDGIRPVDDRTVEYAKAFLKQVQDEPEALSEPDPFMAGYFGFRAKALAPLLHTRYTAAQMGLSGVVLQLFDPKLAAAVAKATDRIKQGPKDFDSLTEDEREAINAAWSAEGGLNRKFLLGEVSESDRWRYMAGAALGEASAHLTVWHISPKQPILLEWIQRAMKSCREHAERPEAAKHQGLAQAMRAFSVHEGKAVDETRVRAIATSVEEALKASLPSKYRW